MAGAAVASLALGAYNGEQQRKAGSQAATQAREQATAADQAANKANPKRPSLADALYGNQAAGAGGQAGTMLTGPTGVDPNVLSLGRTTLLGGGG